MVCLAVGTYARNEGAGLGFLSRSAGRDWSLGETLGEARNASFAAYSSRHRLYYFVDEDGGALGVYSADAADWRRLARVTTFGEAPCYVALNAEQSCLAVANYGSGSLAFYPLDERGLPGEPIIRQNAGSGPVTDRQDGPHAHCACFAPDGRWLYHVDLGTDEILAYPIEPGSRTLGDRRLAYAAPGGSGPRHLAFHPERRQALLVSELASTLTVLEVGDGAMTAVATVSTLPSGFSGESLGGHLTLGSKGDRAYVTNRGHDSIAVFAWDDDGSLRLLQHAESGGASPRAVALLDSERQVVVANEEAGTVTVFDVMPSGILSSIRAELDVPGTAFVFVVNDDAA